MKKLKTTKKIQNEFKLFQEALNKYCDKINREYARNMNKLIENIAKGENLDIEMLKEKYLNNFDGKKEKIFEINNNTEDTTNNVTTTTTSEIEVEAEVEVTVDNKTNIFEEIIFDKVVIDDKNYYYENKENGRIYDSASKIVGVYKDNQFIIN
jgi:hypothetical protein